MQGDIHVRNLRLHQLEAANRFTELLALAKIGNDHVEAGLHDTKLQPGENHPLVIEPAHQYADPAIYRSHDAIFGNVAIVKHKLSRRASAHTHFLDFLPDGEAFVIFLDQKSGNPARTSTAIRFRIDHQCISIGRIGDPELRAIQNIAALNRIGFQFHGDNVGTCRRFRHSKRSDMLA